MTAIHIALIENTFNHMNVLSNPEIAAQNTLSCRPLFLFSQQVLLPITIIILFIKFK